MINLLICGIGGKMGHTLLAAAQQDKEIDSIVGLDKSEVKDVNIPVFNSYNDLPDNINCIIDFSRPEALSPLLEYAQSKSIPVVLATTGYTDKQLEQIRIASKTLPILQSGNMSFGIAVMCELIKSAANKLCEGFDVEIVETHHNQKVDSPSGTAIMLAKSVNEGLKKPRHITFGRHSTNSKREKDEIGMHSLRGGSVVGEHTVSFFGQDETITITHTAQSKTMFALGAIKAAKFLFGKPNGLYSMKELFYN